MSLLDETISWTFTRASPITTPTVASYQFSALYDTGVQDFGTDISVFPDLDKTLALISGGRVLGEAVAKMWLTRRGSLVFHPDRGVDIRDYLNESIDGSVLAEIRTLCEREAEQDERVDSCTVLVTYDPTTQEITIAAALETAEGPYRFTLGVTSLTTSMLSEG